MSKDNETCLEEGLKKFEERLANLFDQTAKGPYEENLPLKTLNKMAGIVADAYSELDNKEAIDEIVKEALKNNFPLPPEVLSGTLSKIVDSLLADRLNSKPESRENLAVETRQKLS